MNQKKDSRDNSIDISNGANYENINFLYKLDIHNRLLRTNIGHEVKFVNCDFQGDVIFQNNLKFTSIIKFENCNFKGLLNFSTAMIYRSIIFDKVKFEKYLPDLHTIDFRRKEPVLSFNSVSTIDREIAKQFKIDFDKNAENTLLIDVAYIRSQCIKLNDHLSEMNFFALEIKARNKIGNWYNKLTGFFYTISSNYGKYWLLPIFWIVMIASISFVIQYCNTGTPTLNYCGEPKGVHVAVLAIKPSLPFALGFDNETVECARYLFDDVGYYGLWGQFMLMVQTFFSTLLWFLSALAIRNRYRIH
ncbi:MAG TPA: hypothetical protein PK055_10685 [Gammaproteobacteria bacterium]|nr:hypothetical protein [Gammaproteobacteria bacterium]HPQ88114.1 hypothetical protein [Gammaproteobacteria bacterium]